MAFPRKILAIKLRSLGDTVLMTAPLLELRKAYPLAEIHVLVSAAWATLLENHPAVDQIWVYERHREMTSRAKALTRMALQLRPQKYDLVVNFHASPSSATLAFATGAKTRSVHFHGHNDKNRYSTVEVPGKGTLKPIIERDMDAVRALGLPIPEGRRPSLFLRDSEKEFAKNRLQKLELGQPVLGISLGASRPTKSWPVERFATLAVSWVMKTGGSALAISGPSEIALAQEFLKHLDDSLTLMIPEQSKRALVRAAIVSESDLSIRQLVAVLNQVDLVVGNDSGPRHLAIAVETPTVTLFGPEDPFEWHPYDRDENPVFYIENLACRRDAMPGMPPWCGINLCIEERHRCMREIGVNQVMDQCLKMVKAS